MGPVKKILVIVAPIIFAVVVAILSWVRLQKYPPYMWIGIITGVLYGVFYIFSIIKKKGNTQ